MYSVASNIPADLNPLIIVSFFVISDSYTLVIHEAWSNTQEDEEENVDGGLEEEDVVIVLE